MGREDLQARSTFSSFATLSAVARKVSSVMGLLTMKAARLVGTVEQVVCEAPVLGNLRSLLPGREPSDVEHGDGQRRESLPGDRPVSVCLQGLLDQSLKSIATTNSSGCPPSPGGMAGARYYSFFGWWGRRASGERPRSYRRFMSRPGRARPFRDPRSARSWRGRFARPPRGSRRAPPPSS